LMRGDLSIRVYPRSFAALPLHPELESIVRVLPNLRLQRGVPQKARLFAKRADRFRGQFQPINIRAVRVRVLLICWSQTTRHFHDGGREAAALEPALAGGGLARQLDGGAAARQSDAHAASGIEGALGAGVGECREEWRDLFSGGLHWFPTESRGATHQRALTQNIADAGGVLPRDPQDYLQEIAERHLLAHHRRHGQVTGGFGADFDGDCRGKRQLGRLLHLTAADAGNTNANRLVSAIHYGAHSLQVRIPAPLRQVVSVADPMPAQRLLAADFADVGHNVSSLTRLIDKLTD